MRHYNLSEFTQLILEDIGVADLPVIETVGVDKIIKRIKNSSLKEFEILYPYRKHWLMTEANLKNKNNNFNAPAGIDYIIPETAYAGHTLLGVGSVNPKSTSGFSDSYIPFTASFSPENIISTVATVQMTADLSRNLAKAMTFKFSKPNQLKVYSGWSSGEYEVDLFLSHDDSLSTIPDTAFTQFRKLTEYDVEWFLYNRFKRITNLDLGIGNIDLKIDDWADAQSKFYELIEELSQRSNLDTDEIIWI